MDKKEILRQIKIFQKNTMTDHLGIEITVFGKDYIIGRMPVNDRTKKTLWIIAWWCQCSIAETLGSIGAGMQIDYNKQSVVGIEINASHLKSISKDWVFLGKQNPLELVKEFKFGT
ncbi:MAG: hypothetical protein Ct9H300mP18_05910 [Candidatus Neomarinimicrobiota bacterium]|nr:MAG: hypothetical protein Ct9H300mP18_05910 [Candidatus Neomarinimicrobiota bacterium]